MNKKFMFAVLALSGGVIYTSAPQADGKAKVEKEGAEKKKKNVLVTLPSAKVLVERLTQIGMAHFAEKTGIHEELGDQQKYAMGVAIAVECAYSNYDAYLKNPKMKQIMNMAKGNLIKTILKDSPEAIAELEAAKLIE